jgi:hypothetical protein
MTLAAMLTRIGVALVQFPLAPRPSIARGTVTHKSGHFILTASVIETRIVATFINVGLASFPIIPWRTATCVIVD